jgi:hypothetical protein
MGANVIRLARTDHRRIHELIDRLTRRYRAGEALPARVLGELSAHVEASATALLPFAESRITALDPAYAATLDELAAVADELAEAPRPVPPELTERLAAVIGRHVEIEEQAVLQPLADEIGVERLRMLGEHFRRCRDARLKAKGNAPRRNHRPPASRAELYERARIRGIEGRSTMSRNELLHALREAQ